MWWQVETLQEGVIKLVRRTELKERIARCHSLLLSLTMLNQAICNGMADLWYTSGTPLGVTLGTPLWHAWTLAT